MLQITHQTVSLVIISPKVVAEHYDQGRVDSLIAEDLRRLPAGLRRRAPEPIQITTTQEGRIEVRREAPESFVDSGVQ